MVRVPERRQNPRITWPAPGRAYFGNDEVACNVVDVSVSGMGLVAPCPSGVGTFMRIHWTAPGNEWIDVDGIVVRTQQRNDLGWLWGIRIQHLSAHVATRIMALVRPADRPRSAPAHSAPRIAEPSGSERLPHPISNQDLAALFREALEAHGPTKPKK